MNNMQRIRAKLYILSVRAIAQGHALPLRRG